MSEKQKKVEDIKEKMKNLDPSSQKYQTYSDILRTLQRPAVVLHRDGGGDICESCQ